MKFIELKKKLANDIERLYLLEGEDRFVVNSALALIENKVALTMPSVNRIVIEGDGGSLDDILFQIDSFPFGDLKKLVIIRDFATKENTKKLELKLANLPDYVVIVVVSYAQNVFTKAIKNYATIVDCGKLDDSTIKSWIGGNLRKSGVGIEELAVNNLILYTNSNMARIETELNKLISMGEPVINAELVEKYVTKDKEYQIYELADFLSKKDGKSVYDLVETMLLTEKNPVGMIQYLYSAFRKLLLISLSNETDEALSKVFKCKPYAVKMSRLQAKKFTPKTLKRINEELSQLEYDIKSGRANQDNAVHITVAKILMGA